MVIKQYLLAHDGKILIPAIVNTCKTRVRINVVAGGHRNTRFTWNDLDFGGHYNTFNLPSETVHKISKA
jgi:hypothetical protein